jgi:hypothetical protein
MPRFYHNPSSNRITAPMIMGAIENNLEELDEGLLPFYKSIAKNL